MALGWAHIYSSPRSPAQFMVPLERHYTFYPELPSTLPWRWAVCGCCDRERIALRDGCCPHCYSPHGHDAVQWNGNEPVAVSIALMVEHCRPRPPLTGAESIRLWILHDYGPSLFTHAAGQTTVGRLRWRLLDQFFGPNHGWTSLRVFYCASWSHGMPDARTFVELRDRAQTLDELRAAELSLLWCRPAVDSLRGMCVRTVWRTLHPAKDDPP